MWRKLRVADAFKLTPIQKRSDCVFRLDPVGVMMVWPFTRKPKPWPKISPEEIKKRARIVVIDDAEFFYLDLFLRDGYTIERWHDVTDLPKLEHNYYDVILLDIHGVGRDKSQEQGLGILKHLKRTTPAQIIVAYSSADWPLKYKEFFDRADATLDKRADYVEFKHTIDDLLAQRFSMGFYADRIVALARSASVDAAGLRTVAEKAILRANPSTLEAFLKRTVDDKQTIALILQVAQTAIGVLQMMGAR